MVGVFAGMRVCTSLGPELTVQDKKESEHSCLLQGPSLSFPQAALKLSSK